MALAWCSATVIQWSADNRQGVTGKRVLTCGRMLAHGLRGQKGNIFFPFSEWGYRDGSIGMGV